MKIRTISFFFFFRNLSVIYSTFIYHPWYTDIAMTANTVMMAVMRAFEDMIYNWLNCIYICFGEHGGMSAHYMNSVASCFHLSKILKLRYGLDHAFKGFGGRTIRAEILVDITVTPVLGAHVIEMV